MLGKPRIRLNNLKTSLRFPCLGLNPIIDSISHSDMNLSGVWLPFLWINLNFCTCMHSCCISNHPSNALVCLVSRDTGVEVARCFLCFSPFNELFLPDVGRCCVSRNASVSVARRGLILACRDLTINYVV